MYPPVLYCDYRGDFPAIPVGGIVTLPWQRVHLYPVDGDTDVPVVNEGRYVEGWIAMQSGGTFYVDSSYIQQNASFIVPYPAPFSPVASTWSAPVPIGISLRFRVAIYAPFLRLRFLVSAPTHVLIQAWVVDNL